MDPEIKPEAFSLGLATRGGVARQKGPYTVKKREIEDLPETPQENILASYNSTFLAGKCEDIGRVERVDALDAGKTNGRKDDQGKDKDSVLQEIETGESEQMNPSVKRRRVSTTKLENGYLASFLSFPLAVDTSKRRDQDSLYKDAHCKDIPATVSDSFASQYDLERKASFSLLPSEDSGREAEGDFGWYVEMDDDYDNKDSYQPVNPYIKSTTSRLAFSAAPASKRMRQYDAEVEYALAADTVDDVLADFF